eukprot:5474956-Pyramimonas_sp.AAC.1
MHDNCATGTFGGAPSWATERCTGRGKRTPTAPLGHSVELPLGPRNAELGGGSACELRRWNLW